MNNKLLERLKMCRDEIKKAVLELLESGEHPNTITEFIESVIVEQGKYELWGDGRWRLATVCSICGSGVPGICGHQNNPEQTLLLRREYEKIAI